MKTMLLALAGVVMASGLTPIATVTAADAQTVVRERTVVERHGRPGWNHHNRWRQRCTWRWRHGHRVRVCRRVRW